jgi:hypothetical protein
MARDFNTKWQQARRGERSGLFAAEDAYGQRFSGRHLSKAYGQKASSFASSPTQLAQTSLETVKRFSEANRRMNALVDTLAAQAARSLRGY